MGGTSLSPQAFLDNLGVMFTRWDNQALNVTTMFASDENVAVFGDFRYKSHSLGQDGELPVLDPGKGHRREGDLPAVLQDSYATAASFRKDGSWTVQTEPGAEPFQV